MPLSWNEIRDRAVRFSREWDAEAAERAGAQTFWNEFFEVFGISRRRVAAFEAPVKQRKDGGKLSTGFIDLFWKGQLLVEHKSRGRDLDRAFTQAIDYFPGIPERDLPRWILVSDFAHFRLYDLEADEHWQFDLKDLHKQVRLFGFIAGYESRALRAQDPVNLKAAERMGLLHDKLLAAGYDGHPLEVLLVRMLFCLFADDTGIFQPQSFREWIENETREDGSDLGARLTELFQVLNTPPERRLKTRDEALTAFPYVNGRLFAEMLPIPAFDGAMRSDLLDACALDWGQISPAIFGGLFQSIMDPKARRNLGAHYTSETNILKLIEPLFLDELRAEFERCRGNHNRLFELQKKLRSLTFFDPACGCGNFLVVAYRELRLLELDILRIVRDTHTRFLDVFGLVQLNVDQFYGIEIEEFPAQIAQVALWLTDHQMNQQVSTEFGQYFARLPLTTAPNIVHGNALTMDWRDVIAPERLSYILGNPPFVGHHYQSAEQKSDQSTVMRSIAGSGVIDFVANWHVKACEYMHEAPHVRCAFVSTNSITQGEQVGLLWPHLLGMGARINFAHRTFQWSSEAKGSAAVHCVIVGFACEDANEKWIYEYETVRGEPHAVRAQNINPYLVDAPDVVLGNRSTPISQVPRMLWGNKPTDGGHLILSPDERDELLAREPAAAPFVRRYVSGGDLLNDGERYCLWLVEAQPGQLRALPEVMRRVEAVRRFREASKAASTRDFARMPTLFRQISQPSTPYLAIPEVSSERRAYIPIAFLGPEVICSNTVQFVSEAEPFHLGVLTSVMHMAWVRAICGRLKSDFRYSNTIVYNNFPWPDAPSDKHRQAIEAAAQAVLDARAAFPDSSLADLYDPLAMPQALLKAHQQLDRAVDAAYGFKGKTDAERVAFLFQRYQALTSLLPAPKAASRRAAPRKPTA